MEKQDKTIAGFFKRAFKAQDDESLENSKTKGEIMDSLTTNATYNNAELIGQEDEAEVIAVIMAALYASLGQAAGGLVINKIRRTSGPKIAWSQAGLTDSIASRNF